MNGIINYILDFLSKDVQTVIKFTVIATVTSMVTYNFVKYLFIFIKNSLLFSGRTTVKVVKKIGRGKDHIICHRCNRHLNQCICADNAKLTSKQIYQKYRREDKLNRKLKKIKMKTLKNK